MDVYGYILINQNVFMLQEESAYEPSVYDDSDTELEDRSRPHPIDEKHSRPALRLDTEKHINPRTGEVIDGVKQQPADKNPLSYDVQNIEPVAPASVIRRYGIKEEGSSHSSTKDSAYGSMDAKVNSSSKTATYRPENKQTTTIESTSKNSPSRSLNASSTALSNIQQNKSPMSVHAQRIQKSEEVFSKELESLKGSTSTLHSLGNSSRSNSIQVTRNGSLDLTQTNGKDNMPPQNEHIGTTSRPSNPVVTQNGFSPGAQNSQPDTPKYVSLKHSAYDRVALKNEVSTQEENNPQNKEVLESPYTSMMNIVQGQMQISPHSNEINRNIVNVSVTSVNRNRRK